MAYTTVNKSTDYFNTKLYSGTGSSNALTGVGFQPDFTWIKTRSTTYSHTLTDAVRGVTKHNASNSSNAEYTSSTEITSFDSDGFTVGTDSGVNNGSHTFASWNWKAGTTGSGTSTGSGTGKAYSYSVSTTSGFSIVKYVGNGTAGHTIPHHLGAVPKMLITKNLGRGEHWRVYHASLGNANKLSLNNTTASASATEWNSTTPTSSVFSIGTGEQINYNDDNYIAYCFAEKKGFSKFGSYVGNGNADGAFVYTGFKPAFVLIKKTSASEEWNLIDNKRIGYNDLNYGLLPNTNGAEITNTDFRSDLLSNGFKMRVNTGYNNGSGASYIFMAFAAAPLVGTNNVPATAR